MVLGSTLDTRRMRGEPIGPQHRDGLMALLGDPRVGETLGGAATPADVDAQIAWVRRRWAEHGFGWYAFLDRGSGALVARGGPQATHVEGSPAVEVGWAVHADRWGQGLATELGAASVAHAFGPLGLCELVSFTLPDNLASRRVMEKLGFSHAGEIEHAGLPHVLYRLSAATARSTSASVV